MKNLATQAFPEYADGTLTHILNIAAEIYHTRGRDCEAESSFPSASARAHILVRVERICKALRSCAKCEGTPKAARG